LAISKQIVCLLGGEIGVDSTPGQGSRFWFTAPCTVGTLSPAALPAATKKIDRNARILIAEDNATNQAVAVGMLRLLGCSSGIARNGVEAVAHWQDGNWDLILMDCSMPEMDGFQATAAIRSLEAGSGRHIPIIAMTANTLAHDIERCKIAGMDGHLSKPLTLEALTCHLEQWLQISPHQVVRAEAVVATADNPPFDTSVLDRLREFLGDSVSEAIRPFLEDMPGYLFELEGAIAVANADTIRKVAHV